MVSKRHFTEEEEEEEEQEEEEEEEEEEELTKRKNKINKRPMDLDDLLENQLGHWQKIQELHIDFLSTPRGVGVLVDFDLI